MNEATDPSGSRQSRFDTFAWTLSDLLPGDGGTVQVRATVDPAAPPGSVIVNEARLTSPNSDLSPANNLASVRRKIACADCPRTYLPLVFRGYP